MGKTTLSSVLVAVLIFAGFATGQTPVAAAGLKVFISVDMEGVSGVINPDDVVINGKKMPEAGINGLIAGMFDVPVVLVSGDKAIGEQTRELFGDVETVVVKEGIGSAELGIHPIKTRELIWGKATSALKRLKDFKPFKVKPPYTLDVAFTDEEEAQKAARIPGAVRVDVHTVRFTADTVMDLLKLFRLAKM
ncbi:MAG: M55 family metallopeptidase [Candidatus Aminicenantes bacterium]|nr:M55 family metallopeptidase [Candidatus Aminicenantes bacterium]